MERPAASSPPPHLHQIYSPSPHQTSPGQPMVAPHTCWGPPGAAHYTGSSLCPGGSARPSMDECNAAPAKHWRAVLLRPSKSEAQRYHGVHADPKVNHGSHGGHPTQHQHELSTQSGEVLTSDQDDTWDSALPLLANDCTCINAVVRRYSLSVPPPKTHKAESCIQTCSHLCVLGVHTTSRRTPCLQQTHITFSPLEDICCAFHPE